MLHLFALFPILIILAIVSHNSYKKDKNVIAFYYFRNFFLFWSVCTIFRGVIDIAQIQKPLSIWLGGVIGVPFYYFALAYLIRIPFGMYNKKMIIANIASTVVVLIGILIGLSDYFGKISNIANAGILSPVIKYILSTGLYFRVFTTILFMVPTGLFFFYEAYRSTTLLARTGSAIIGFGIVLASIFEPQHILFKHIHTADFGVTFAFIVILLGLLLPTFFKSKETNLQ
jgi:hypothetical protein